MALHQSPKVALESMVLFEIDVVSFTVKSPLVPEERRGKLLGILGASSRRSTGCDLVFDLRRCVSILKRSLRGVTKTVFRSFWSLASRLLSSAPSALKGLGSGPGGGCP